MISPALQMTTFWACVISAVSRPVMGDWKLDGFQGVLSNGFGANYIVWFALIVATMMMKERILKISPLIWTAALMLMIYPSSMLSWLGASLMAASMVVHSSRNLAAVLLLVTALREPVTAICMKIFAGNILGLDALMTNGVLMLMGSTSLIQSNIVITESGHPLLILTGCSVFTNLSYNSLLWFCLHVFYEKKITRLSWIVLGVTLLLTLFSNALRLALMTRSQEAYLYYHDGLGSQIFEWGLLGLVLLLVMGGCRYAKYR